MTAHQQEPTREELLAMAYVDGELPPDEAAELESRLADDAALAKHVAHYRALDLLARQMAPPEPADHEWARLEADPFQSGGTRFAYALVAVGGLGLVAYGLWGLATAGSVSPVPRACLGCLVVGALLLLGLTLRARLRLLPLDPYRKVQR